MALIIVTGLPGSGKSTLAAALSRELNVPLIAKDHFKEILFDALGVGDMEWSRKIGQAAIALQYEAMALAKVAVVDSALWTGLSEPELARLDLPMVQVYCACPFDTARTRFFARQTTGDRHPGFAEENMTHQDYERFRPLNTPLKLEAPLISVDTTLAFDATSVVAQIRSAHNATERPSG